MNHDITHCTNTQCPQASSCRRSTIHFSKFPPPTQWISYASFAPDPKTGKCEDFWPLDTIEQGIHYKQKEESK